MTAALFLFTYFGIMQDSTLLLITVCVISLDAILAVLIGFAMPRYMVDEEMVGYSATCPKARGPTFFLKKIDQYRIRSQIETYPYIVSVSRFIYKNDINSLEFTCTGFLITTDKVLTGKDCIAPMVDESSFREYIVRSESSYFNRGGRLHSIKKVHKTPTAVSFFPLYLLVIDPPVSSKTVLPNLALYATIVPQLTTLGFGGYILPRHDVLLEAPFYVNNFLKSDSFTGIKYAPIKYPKAIPTLLDYDKELVSEKAELCFNECVQNSSRRQQSFLTDGRPIICVQWKPLKHYIFGMRMKGMKSWKSINEDKLSTATYQNFLAFDEPFFYWLKNEFEVPLTHLDLEITQGNMTQWYKWMYMEEAQIYIKRYHFIESTFNLSIPKGPGKEDDD